MNIWQGNCVRLRALLASDWEYFYQQDQDSATARDCDQIYFPRSEEATRLWAERAARESATEDQGRWVIENNAGIAVGVINTFDCDPRNGTFKYGLAIGQDHRRQRHARDAITILLRYYFGERRYQKVTVTIHEFNQASIRLHQRLGFSAEGRLRRMIFTNGRHYDLFFYGLTAEEFWSSVGSFEHDKEREGD
jgi:RimJ/RimL family protein N-acetyltransferase